MIKINLALRKQPVGGGGGVAKTGSMASLGSFDLSSLKGLKIDTEALKDLPLRKVALPLIIGALASFTLDNYRDSELKALDAQMEVLAAEKPKLEAEANKIKQYEGVKKDLEADEFTIRTKIETIRKLVAGRTVPPKLLLALASTMPEEVWISGFKMASSSVTLQGFSYGFGPISDFMKNMSESAYFTDLKLNRTEQVREQGIGEVATFELDAKRR